MNEEIFRKAQEYLDDGYSKRQAAAQLGVKEAALRKALKRVSIIVSFNLIMVIFTIGA